MKWMACPRCRRQHNVAGLDPSSLVRCVCDEILQVAWARVLAVNGLVCVHCGAPCGADDRECVHCGCALSELDRKATLLCPECGVRLPDDSRYCKVCAVELRPQALQAIPEGTVCPRCKGALRVRLLSEWDVIECEACAGLWFEPLDFERLCRIAAKGSPNSVDAWTQASGTPPTGKTAYIPCIRCKDFMQRRAFRRAGKHSGIVLDSCRQHGVWLDHEELGRVIEFLRQHPEAVEPSVWPLAQWPVEPRPPSVLNHRIRWTSTPLGEAIEFVMRLLGHYF